MNVMNRKLFANRDARRKLASMGGIMVSSPELMQAAQMFQVGGQIGSPTAQKVKTVKAPYSGIMYDVYTDGRVVEANSGRTLDPTNAVQATIIRDIKALPGATNENSGIIAASPVLDKELGSTTLDMALDAIDKRQDEGRISLADANFEKIIAMGRLSDIEKQYPEAVDYGLELIMPPIPPSEKNNESNPNQADIDAAVESFTEAATENNFDGPIKKSGSTLSGSNFTLPPNEGYPYPTDSPEFRKTKPKITEEKEPADDIPSSDIPGFTGEKKEAEIKDLETAANDPNASSNQRSSNVSTQVLTDAGFEDVSNMTTKQRVAAYQEMFKEFLGEGDEDANEEKWHNLAMIGFAIAAGQDPSALANIANGLLEGSKVMKGDRAARRKREDSITSMAIEQVFSEKAAEKDAQLRRELAAAKTGSGFRDPRNPIDAFLNAKSDAKKLLDDVTYRSMLEKQGVTDFDQWASDQAMRTVQETYPPSTLIGTPFEIKETPTQTTPTATDLPTINTQEEYDALPPGSEFFQIVDGKPQKRRKE